MRPSSPGRPGWNLFPAGWEAHHTPIAELQRTGLCHLWSGPPARATDPTTGAVVWTYGTRLTDEPVPVRLQQLGEQENVAGGQDVTTHRYRATLARDTSTVTVGGVIEVVDASDPTMPGRYLPIVDLLRGTLRWQRDCIVTDHLG